MHMSQKHLSIARWRKSSYSDGGPGNCVEVAEGHPNTVPVRDSKDPDGPALYFTSTAWTTFVNAIKNSEFPTG